MKLAIISDMHGNVPALDAALASLEREGVTNIICLGDVASFGPQPVEALRRVQALACPVVLGNADVSLLEPHQSGTDDPRDETAKFFLEVDQWCAEQLTDNDRAFIRTFAPTVEIDLDGQRVLCCHGSPKSYNDIIVATTPDEELGNFLGEEDSQIVCGGHTHAQLLRRYRETTFVNPGSLGLPYEYDRNGEARNPHWAEYALLEHREGQLSVTFRRVPYDPTPLIEAARSSGMPQAERWLEGWLR